MSYFEWSEEKAELLYYDRPCEPAYNDEDRSWGPARLPLTVSAVEDEALYLDPDDDVVYSDEERRGYEQERWR